MFFLQPNGVPPDGAAEYIERWAGKGVRKGALIGGAASKRSGLQLVRGNNRHPSACVCVRARARYTQYQNTCSMSKTRPFLGSEDICCGPHNFKGPFEGLGFKFGARRLGFRSA